MHVLHRPQLPRLVSVTLAVAFLAIVISLALASSLSNISEPDGNTSTPAHRTTVGLTSSLDPKAPSWINTPFANLISQPPPRPRLNELR